MKLSRWIAAGLGVAGVVALGACRGEAPTDAEVTDDELALARDSAPLFPIEAMIDRAKRRDTWPVGDADWRALDAAAQARLMSRPGCAELDAMLFPPADADAKTAAALGKSVSALTPEEQALRSDGVVVVKNGTIVYEKYVGPYAGHPEKRHCMWSATKSFTTGMMGAIVQSSERLLAGDTSAPGAKLARDGRAIGLGTTLSELADLGPDVDPRVAKLTVEDLLAMNLPSPAWNEGYDGNIATSSVVKMLWADGARDMGGFASRALLGPPVPDAKTSFRYSSGTAVVLMKALKGIYGDAYDRMPWTVLFDRLGMTSTVLERDPTGTFVGSSYAHMTLRDMARFGYAYLNGGWFAGEQVIHPTFVQKARELGTAMRSPGTSQEAIEEEGAFYSLGFWINPSPRVLTRTGVRSFDAKFPKNDKNGLVPGSKFFPKTPVDVFFAAGHYGQNVLVFPADDLLVVRMSHDNEYFSKLDRMMDGARRCFLGRNEVVR